jgi:hypothetical protein
LDASISKHQTQSSRWLVKVLFEKRDRRVDSTA